METIELQISGMTCNACVNHVTQGLQGVLGVKTVAVDLASAKATVTGDSLEVAPLIEAVEEEGYEAALIEGGPKPSADESISPLNAEGCSCCTKTLA